MTNNASKKERECIKKGSRKEVRSESKSSWFSSSLQIARLPRSPLVIPNPHQPESGSVMETGLFKIESVCKQQMSQKVPTTPPAAPSKTVHTPNTIALGVKC
ncbi:hypothetical protein VE03_02942 [Pseudogymnoascus sp. 23342-1-I1]|nr:hypothetical protein VE03_02942 [Pseudogymnoascus sp. 23342-1-I1]